MPERLVRPEVPMGERTVKFEQEAFARTYKVVEDVKRFSFWNELQERGYQGMLNKLKEQARIIDPNVDLSFLPCLAEESEAKSMAEGQRIKRAQKVFVSAFPDFLERFDRLRPESKLFAIDSLRDGIDQKRMLWRPYECEKFRASEDSNTKKGKKD